METFTVQNLSFYYPEQEHPAIRELSFSVNKGQFVTLCGPSGCGKSTLLRLLKPVLSAHGNRHGEIIFEGRLITDISLQEQARRIGFVQQSPENQIVTDKVWHELAFGLESLGYDTLSIRSRVAEMASYFGIETWFYKNVSELSGGQKQLLNLASVMVMQPSVLILDEPCSQLDPIAASNFIDTLGKINRELGITVILTEHRLEEAFSLSDKILVMDKGELIAEGIPDEIGRRLKAMGHGMFLAMPTAMRVWAAVENREECPVTVRDGRKWLEGFAEHNSFLPLHEKERRPVSKEVAVELTDIWFRYEKNSVDVLKGVNFQLNQGVIFALLGGNGVGKSTMLSVMGGVQRPYRGQHHINGSVAVLPQNPQTVFVKKTVLEDLWDMFKASHLEFEAQQARINDKITICGLENLLNRHPYDLSGGEQQRLALAKVLLTEPDILLLDEPTKGLDREFKKSFAYILRTLQKKGVSIFLVSHDVEFCAEYCDRCALLFDGNIVAENVPRLFFSGNSFYTTAANRMARGILPEAVTAEDIISACGGELPESIENESTIIETVSNKEKQSSHIEKTLPLLNKIIAGFSLMMILTGFIKTLTVTDLSEILCSEGLRISGENFVWMILIIAGLFIFALAIYRKPPSKNLSERISNDRRKLSGRTMVAVGLVLLIIPITLFAGIYCFEGRKYYFTSLLILLETMLPFFFVFEGRKPQPRELVVIASLCAIGIAGRAAFFMLPGFKPVMALVILSGIAFGGESGFLVGAMTMLCSNVLFGQGPWTPWQMFAMGITGFLAGVLSSKGILGRNRGGLCVFGAICAIVIYGGIMNPVSALIWAQTMNRKILLTYYLTGLPLDLVQASATAIFLWFASKPILEKLERIKIKYGLMEN